MAAKMAAIARLKPVFLLLDAEFEGGAVAVGAAVPEVWA